jgi:plastocyanin
MRGLVRIVVVAVFLVGTPGTAAHPGHGADAVTIEGDAFRFAPELTTVGVGDTVIWFWEGSLFRNHSVTADPGQAEQFDSDPGATPTNAGHPWGSSFSHSFTRKGRFAYHCKVHPSMRGVVEVVDVPDRIAGAPKIRALRIDSGRRRPLALFRLSERAELVGRIAKRRGGRWREAESFFERARRGKNRFAVPVRGLGPGRYRLSLIAYDAANRRSNVARTAFRLEGG